MISVKIKALLFVILYFFAVVLIWQLISSYIIDKDSLRNFISGYGNYGPLIFILINYYTFVSLLRGFLD